MITNWEQFYGTVKRMREHQKAYFATKDFVALGQSKKFEKMIDDCIAEREQRKEEGGRQ